MSAGLTARSAAHHFGPNVDARHYVYRCYDAEGTLLYIGCTVNVSRRIGDHRRGAGGSRASMWLAACMDRFEVEGPFDGREAGRDAERCAIKAERPLFNFQERTDVDFAASMTRSQVAAYLVEHGHRALALATACTCWRETRDAGDIDGWCHAHATGRSSRQAS